MPDDGSRTDVARLHAADVAAGLHPADAVLTGARLVDVHRRECRSADVAIAGSRIAAVGDVRHCTDASTTVHDCSGLHVLPGLLEPHFHVGFSQVSVERLAEVLVPMGTIALSGCFSESSAIVGGGVVQEQLRRLEGSGLDVLLSPFYVSALRPGPSGIGVRDFLDLVRDDRCVEIREWGYGAHRTMAPELRQAWSEALGCGRAIAGHLAGQTGPALQASVALGVQSDHEATTVEEALERVGMGVAVQIREGSALRDLERLLPAVTEHGADPDMFSFCSDEQELHDLLEHGHMDGKLRLAVKHGVAPVEAVRMATLNAARSMGVEFDYGSITPGRLASVVLVEDLRSFRVERVFSRGRLIAEGGTYLGSPSSEPYPPEWTDTVHVPRTLSADDFGLGLADGEREVRAIGVTPGSAVTAELVERVTVAAGRLSPEAGLAKLALADRHEGSGRIGVGLIKGLEIEAGAVASTINAGGFNLLVAGADDEDMALAANRAVELSGGIVVARGGVVRAELPLPLFGIVSHAPLDETVAAARRVAEAIRDELGSSVRGVVPLAGFACLAGYPNLKLTDRGPVRVQPAKAPERVGVGVR